jgi:uncharacterized protein (TIGR02996 family)
MTTKPRSIFEYLNDESERPYIIAALEGKLDDPQRLAYAELINDRDPARAEWIRLEVRLNAEATEDQAIHRRFAEVRRTIGADFVRFMRRKDILNCGSGSKEARQVRFSFLCERRWETLHPTEEASVRHCNSCDSRVYQCTTVPEAEAHARAGHCIAVSSDIVDKAAGGGYRNAVGRPDPVADWGRKLFPEE